MANHTTGAPRHNARQDKIYAEIQRLAAAKKGYPELDAIAERVASAACRNINEGINGVESEMPYRAQYVLEKTIELLQKRV
jgi:hypothetical protein